MIVAIKDWILRIIDNMQKKPNGKQITIFATTRTIKDYQTGLSKRNHKGIAETISYNIAKSLTNKIIVSAAQKIDMTMQKISYMEKQQKHPGDRFDVSFLSLTNAIIQNKRWSDREIIFATRDRRLAQEIEKSFKRIDSRIHVADDLKSFEKLIEC